MPSPSQCRWAGLAGKEMMRNCWDGRPEHIGRNKSKDEGSTFLRNVCKHLPSHRALRLFIAIAIRRLRQLRRVCQQSPIWRLLGYSIAKSVEGQPTFRMNMSPPLEGRRISQARQCFLLVSCLAYSSTLNMRATCSSETSVDLQRTARRYILEDTTLHNHRCEKLKSSNQVYGNVLIPNFR
jgi:hypothetical protein